jgi:hypothetical protein
MSFSKKNHQGFVILGLDFATNYGEDIAACCQFEFNGYEISVSTGAVNTKSGEKTRFPQPVLITDLITKAEHSINGSVQDAIAWILTNPAFDADHYNREVADSKDL